MKKHHNSTYGLHFPTINKFMAIQYNVQSIFSGKKTNHFIEPDNLYTKTDITI